MPRSVGSYTPEEASRFRPRPVQILLRDHRLVDANIHIRDGQPLTVFLGAQRTFTNLTEVRWADSDAAPAPHVAVRRDHILWMTCLDANVPLSRQSGRLRNCAVEVHLDSGTILEAALDIADRQRLTDYLEGIDSGFLPLYNVHAATGAPLGDLAVNLAAVMSVQEATTEALVAA